MRAPLQLDAGGSRNWGLTPLIVVALLLASCGTAPKKVESIPGGKYYADDGPPDSVPDNLAQIPDAVPRDEAFHRFANRPYTVMGRSFAPVVNREPWKQRGIASWYGKKFHGLKTASGEPYDMFAMTAAHPTLPIPSYARVTNLRNRLSVVVRINDRGPFHSDRIIDLSYAAAARIGIAAAGSGLVEVERVFESTQSTSIGTPAPTIPVQALVESPLVAEESAAFWLQLGAFSTREAAESFRDRAVRELSWNLEPVQVQSRDALFRVRLGPYRNREEALAIAEKARATLGFPPAVMTR
jgi:rare lipoprotein A